MAIESAIVVYGAIHVVVARMCATIDLCTGEILVPIAMVVK